VGKSWYMQPFAYEPNFSLYKKVYYNQDRKKELSSILSIQATVEKPGYIDKLKEKVGIL